MSGKNANAKSDDQDCECYSKSRSPKACPPVRNVTHPLVRRLFCGHPVNAIWFVFFRQPRYYEFTQDEIKALEECDKESFYQRCLPFSTLFATVTYAAMRWGWLKKNPHFGMVPKVLIAALFGHFYGRYAYMEQCEQKLRALPENSHLGSTMRKYHLERNPPPDPNKRR